MCFAHAAYSLWSQGPSHLGTACASIVPRRASGAALGAWHACAHFLGSRSAPNPGAWACRFCDTCHILACQAVGKTAEHTSAHIQGCGSLSFSLSGLRWARLVVSMGSSFPARTLSCLVFLCVERLRIHIAYSCVLLLTWGSFPLLSLEPGLPGMTCRSLRVPERIGSSAFGPLRGTLAATTERIGSPAFEPFPLAAAQNRGRPLTCIHTQYASYRALTNYRLGLALTLS